MVGMVALTTVARSQAPTEVAPRKTETLVSAAKLGTEADKSSEDCLCESQVLPEALAIVNGIRITRGDIERATKDQVTQLQRQVVEARKRELDLQVNSRLLAIEAKRRGISANKLIEQEVLAKVKEPTEKDAQAFFDQNRAGIKGDFSAAKDDILQYLRVQRQQDQAKRLADELRKTITTVIHVSKVTPSRNEKDGARVLATINAEKITAGDLEESLRPFIFDVQEQVFRLRENELNLSINDTLLAQESQKRKITTNALLDTEVKPKPITEADASAFYEQNKDRVSGDFATTKDSIIRYLQQIEVRRAERVFVDRLRATASIQTFLIAPQSPVFSIATTDQPSLGNVSAPVTMVEFTDYQCPTCALTQPTLERLVREYGNKVRLVVRDFPLNQHTEAFKAAEAAEAAREQGKFWEYIGILMRNQSALGIAKLKDYATEINLDRSRFDAALDSGKFGERVQLDLAEGMKLGVNGTPTLFINGRRVSDRSYEALKATIEANLKAGNK
jgi:protein-disulfide isomerase